LTDFPVHRILVIDCRQNCFDRKSEEAKMHNSLQLSLETPLDRDIILQRLDRVIDPELDTSILKLGFVKSLEAKDGHLTVELDLPTYWCAPNFSYLMAFDARRELMTLAGVDAVTVRLTGHFAKAAIEAGVNAGKSFSEAFPSEADENLDGLRNLFHRKGYLKRQERLLRCLKKAGLSFEDISALSVADVSVQGEACLLQRQEGRASYVGPAEVVHHYLERRAELGLDCSQTAPLMIDLRGRKIPASRLEEHLIHARTVRLSLEANGAFCCAVLAARKAENTASDSGS
jgi:metal-sulfur cluster biosynthetic enzyme